MNLNSIKKNTLLLTFISGILMILSFPPFKTGFLGFFVFVPLFFALEKSKRPFRLGIFWGAIYFYGLLYWVALADKILIPISGLMVLYLSVYSALFLFIVHKIWVRRKLPLLLIAPLCWVTIEFIMTKSDMAFPWLLMGYTQNYPLQLPQFIEFTGIWGLSFLVLLINCLIFLAIKNFSNKKLFSIYISAIILLFIVPIFYGQIKLNSDYKVEKKARLAILQGSIPQNIKWDSPYKSYSTLTYLALSHQAAQEDSLDLLILPETATACNIRFWPRYLYPIQEVVRDTETPMLLGTLDAKWFGEKRCDYNAAFLFSEAGDLREIYYKIHMVPFSEKMPFDDVLTFLHGMNMGSSDFCQGKERVLFQVEKFKFPAEICYEIIFPDFTRKYVRDGADFLVNITNDAWWLRSSGSYQHASMVKFRAIENRISIARAANTGISFFVDPLGREHEKAWLYERATLKMDVPVFTEKGTFYTEHGDWFPKLCMIGTGILIIIGIVKRFL